ncbi:MAG: GIY-YIG nuclease family protein [Candidatus Sulfotelmatobacter sp.]|jgi:putative endonuclease
MPSRSQKTYFVYIMTNRSKTLYTGVTNSLVRRVREHKLESGSGFAAKYKLDRLAYFERFDDIRNAIEREKRIKGWLRIKKIALIVSVNPEWKDLSAEWYERHQYQPPKASCHPVILRPAVCAGRRTSVLAVSDPPAASSLSAACISPSLGILGEAEDSAVSG